MPNETPADVQGTCFVVMGFGKKTDFETGRTLDLNLTYNYIIKPAVIAARLKCIRADEITHSGPIDVPMYEQLLNADVVVADLSTSNKNAYYELGVRHALKPFTTIVICEDGIKTFPFTSTMWSSANITIWARVSITARCSGSAKPSPTPSSRYTARIRGGATARCTRS